MDKYQKFMECVSHAAERFKEIEKNETIRLVSHLDADGISACSILIKLLSSDNRKYSISIVPQLTREIIMELSREPYSHFIFSDLGSGQLSDIKKYLPNRTIFILDHHKPQETRLTRNIIHLNPHCCGVDGSRDISGSGVIYLFAEQINSKISSMAHIALIGAIGDVQENNGFTALNKMIMDSAIEGGKLSVSNGLRLFGAQSKPLHKVLEYCTDPYIPGVSGSEEGAINFLKELGIAPRKGAAWRKIFNLDEDELKKLIAGIILRRADEENPEDVLGPVYTLKDENKESCLRDAKEFATLLNACGRMGKASLGIGACLGDSRIKARAIRNMENYRKEIMSAMRWYEENKSRKDIISGEGFIIINAKERIMPTIIGTVASILSKSKGVGEGTFVVSMARQVDNNTKVSMRIAGKTNDGMDLREILGGIAKSVGGNSGGHRNAAGAIIETKVEEEFIKRACEVLAKCYIEEVVH